MKEQIAIVKKHIQSELKRSSLEYLKLGLELFHKERKGSAYPRVQPAIGNLSTSVELMIKAFLSAQNPLLIFTDLPLDLKILLLSPEQVPTNTNWRAYDLELRSFGYKTIELNDSISAYGVYFPEEKKKLQSYFKLLSHIRNKSLHASLPSFQTYDLERIGYLALRVLESLRSETSGIGTLYSLKEEDKKFLAIFDEKRIQRVHHKIEEAKSKAKKLSTPDKSTMVYDWENYVTGCPICRNEGVLSGVTELRVEQSGPEDIEPFLDFTGDSFSCNECGLVLDDYEELRLAGMETGYDRSEELEVWFDEREESYPSGDYL